MATEPNTGLTWQEANSLTTDALHNQVVDLLAMWLNCVVLAVGQAAPTGSEAEGDRYIVGTGTGVFAGHDGELAILRGGTWQFHAPPDAGVPIVKNLDDGSDWECVGGVWAEKAGGGGGGGGGAEDVAYDNSTSGLSATNVQAAIDELEAMGGGGGGGGGGFLSVQDEIYKAVAEANMTMTHGASGTLFDKKIDKGGFVILALAGSVRGETFRAGTSYTVPTGKIAVVVDAKFDPRAVSDSTYYKHRLYNSTTTQVPAGPNIPMAGGTAADFIGSARYPGPWEQVNVDIPYPVQAGVAGDTLRAEIAGGPDSNDRPTAGLYVLAIIDASTHQMDAVTA